jgi:hypothetical protein
MPIEHQQTNKKITLLSGSFRPELSSRWQRNKHKSCIEIEPGIGKGKESNLVDPEEVQHCLAGSQKDHLAIQPANTKRGNW